MNHHLVEPINRILLRQAITAWTRCSGRQNAAQRHVGSEKTDDVQLQMIAAREVQLLIELFGGDVEAVEGLLSDALVLINEDVQAIEAGVVADDCATIVEAAHRLKGTAGSLHARPLAQISSLIERAARMEERTTIATLVVELRTITGAIRMQISDRSGFLGLG